MNERAIPEFDERQPMTPPSPMMHSGSGSTSGSVNVTMADAPPVLSSLGAVAHEIERFHVLSQQLEERLAGVMRGPDPVSEAKLATEAWGIPLADDLVSKAQQLGDLNDRLAVLLERLAL